MGVLMMAKTTGVTTGLASERQAGAMGEARGEELRERWAVLLAQWQQSGQSGRAFCRERGLAYAQWLYWRRRLAVVADQSAVPGRALAAGDFVAFAPVRSLGASGESESCGLRLRLAGSWELVLERGFDAGELRRVMGVLTTLC
jgi:hypothetical protein